MRYTRLQLIRFGRERQERKEAARFLRQESDTKSLRHWRLENGFETWPPAVPRRYEFVETGPTGVAP
jgi:hypothetical protein